VRSERCQEERELEIYEREAHGCGRLVGRVRVRRGKLTILEDPFGEIRDIVDWYPKNKYAAATILNWERFGHYSFIVKEVTP